VDSRLFVRSEMKEICLTKGKMTTVDDEDYEYLSTCKWQFSSTGYAVTGKYTSSGIHKIIRMHRVIMNAPSGFQIDHIDGNKLNNCKSNLRICTQFENMANMRMKKVNTSGYIGVHFDKRYSIYGAKIRIGGKQVWLGSFNTPEEAAKVYDDVKVKTHGNLCITNFPQPEPPKGA
jgi:hypothetical protein